MNTIDFLATDLMRWELHGEYYFSRVGEHGMRSVARKEDWDPLENIFQAFEIVEKMFSEKEYVMELVKSITGIYTCVFYHKKFTTIVHTGPQDKNPAAAITLAAVKALKGE